MISFWLVFPAKLWWLWWFGTLGWLGWLGRLGDLVGNAGYAVKGG